ncbi:MAG: ArsR/SmtB family transcription factor [Candidatus Magasanikbacteria bacterium]
MPSEEFFENIQKDLNSIDFREMKKNFSVLASQSRLKALAVFLRRGSKHLCVQDIAEILDISESGASHQLSKLEEAGLLKRSKDGKLVCYRLNKENPMIDIARKKINSEKNKK